MVRVADAATRSGEASTLTPRARNGSTLAGSMSWTISVKPCLTRFSAIGRPMLPSPMNPTTPAIASLLSVGGPRAAARPVRSGVLDADRLGDQGRALLPVDLDGHLGGDADPVVGDVLDVDEALAEPDPCAGLHRADEAHLVRAVVDAVPALLDTQERRGQTRDEGEREVAVRDGLAARHVAPRALHVDVNPLVVTGGVRELVDHRLVDGHPFRRTEDSAHVLLQVFRNLDGQHALLPLSCVRD